MSFFNWAKDKTKSSDWISLKSDWKILCNYNNAILRYKDKYEIRHIPYNDLEKKELVEFMYKNVPIKVNGEQVSLFDIIKEDMSLDSGENMISVGVFDISQEKEVLVLTISIKLRNIAAIYSYFKEHTNLNDFKQIEKTLLYLGFNEEEIQSNYENVLRAFNDIVFKNNDKTSVYDTIGISKDVFFEFTRFAAVNCIGKDSKRENLVLITKIFPFCIGYIIELMSVFFPIIVQKKNVSFFSNCSSHHVDFYSKFFKDMLVAKTDNIILDNGLETNILVYKNAMNVKAIRESRNIIKKGMNDWRNSQKIESQYADYYSVQSYNNGRLNLINNFYMEEIPADLFESYNRANVLAVGFYRKYSDEELKKNNFKTDGIRIFEIVVELKDFSNIISNYAKIFEGNNVGIKAFLDILQRESVNKKLFEIIHFKTLSYVSYKFDSVYTLNIPKMIAFLLLKILNRWKVNQEQILLFGLVFKNGLLYLEKKYSDTIYFMVPKNIEINLSQSYLDLIKVESFFKKKSEEVNLLAFDFLKNRDIRNEFQILIEKMN
ncbi:MAG: hypothetical protein KC550_05505, partial [Nanoarchaeota archaeon]|nr:hypothetical protein [Nanoarchaeota archaeon]